MAKKTAVKEKSYRGSLKEVDDKMTIDSAERKKYAGHKGPMPGIEVKTPYPKKAKKDEVDYLGNKLADLSERVNEVELSIADISNKINRVMGRMGL